jgi:predicted CopG family antitoxin
MKTKMLRITEEAHAALFKAQKVHETFSETIIRLCKEAKA